MRYKGSGSVGLRTGFDLTSSSSHEELSFGSRNIELKELFSLRHAIEPYDANSKLV